MTAEETRVIRVGWLAFDGGLGRPYEGWRQHEDGSWQSAGRALTRAGARRKAEALPAPRQRSSFNVTSAPVST